MSFALHPYLPELAFTSSRVVGDEVYFHPQRRLAEVLVQRNPVYLVLDTPGLKTKMFICFPKPVLFDCIMANLISWKVFLEKRVMISQTDTNGKLVRSISVWNETESMALCCVAQSRTPFKIWARRHLELPSTKLYLWRIFRRPCSSVSSGGQWREISRVDGDILLLYRE